MIPLGVVCALPAERRTLGGVSDRPELELLVAGVGAARATAAAHALADRGVRRLVSWGFAGGLDPALASGRLVVPDAIVDEGGTTWPVAGPLQQRLARSLAPLAPVRARLAAAARIVAGPDAKAALRRATDAAAVDMESAALERVARERGLGFATVRAVVDDASIGLPTSAVALALPDGSTSWAAFARALARRPWELVALVALGRRSRRAAAALSTAARLCFDGSPT